MIRLVDVSRLYRTGAEEVHALDGVSLEINRGEFLAIMGTSGSGKSTMMNIIGCLDRPTAGHYYFEGHDVGRMSDDQQALLRSREFGFIFQQFNLLPRMSAIEQVELPLVYQSKGGRRKRAKEALAMVGLGNRMTHKPTMLSGGQQQRVAIARALVVNPRVILADEPTGALDTRTSEEVMEILEGLVRERGITVILVTHEQDVANYADRIIRMRDGKIVEDAVHRHGQHHARAVTA
ncbi:MAG TPA: ABC transporter ATP-binding protein [Tepidiformaceae bacterium]|nr:ABC transporter ATP-binding protein [Tepidiformaceae bacterium]